MKYIVGISELKEVGDDIVNYSSNDFRNNIEMLYKLKKEMIWKGSAQEAFFDRFDMAINSLYTIENAIEKYGMFLSFCSEHYHDTVSELQKGWNEYLQELEAKKNNKKLEADINKND